MRELVGADTLLFERRSDGGAWRGCGFFLLCSCVRVLSFQSWTFFGNGYLEVIPILSTSSYLNLGFSYLSWAFTCVHLALEDTRRLGSYWLVKRKLSILDTIVEIRRDTLLCHFHTFQSAYVSPHELFATIIKRYWRTILLYYGSLIDVR